VAANPLRSEAAAFHWVLGTLVVAAVIVAASWISSWLGVVVTLALAGLAAWRLLAGLRRRQKQPRGTQERANVEDTPDP
jgi:membrane protein implicated in regulation of membrane protease activity